MATMTDNRLHHRQMLELIREKARKHPELERRVQWSDFLSIAERENISVRVGPLSRPGRITRFLGQHYEIQLDSELPPDSRTFVGMHELVHFWCDLTRDAAWYPDDPQSEAFADLVADYVTSPARTLRNNRGPCVWVGDADPTRIKELNASLDAAVAARRDAKALDIGR